MDLGTILASGWTSGLSLYATALLLGIAGRMDWLDTPGALTEPIVLGVLTILTIVEFMVDKVPWLDSIWDGAHLFIRPIGAAALTGLMAGDSASPEVVVALFGGSLAFSSHSAKSATRALANTSPEPISNVALSLGEDGIVVAMVALAVAYPVVAGVLAVLAGLVCVGVTWVMIRLTRRARAAIRRRRETGSRRPGVGP